MTTLERGLPLLLLVLAPVGVLAVLALGLGGTALLAAGVVAVLVAVVRRPVAGLVALLVFLPLQQVLLSALLANGAPLGAVRQLGGLKELLVLGLVLAAARAARGRPRLDLLDGLALAYLALVTAYLLLPVVAPGLLFDVPFQPRLLSWRTNVLFVVAFLACRRLGLTGQELRRVVRVVLALAALLAGCALLEFAAPEVWSRFLVDVLQVPEFQAQVFEVKATTDDALSRGAVGDVDVVRSGSLLLSALTLGFALVPALGLALERLTAARLQAGALALTVVTALGVATTLTRSALIAAVVTAYASLRYGVLRGRPGRLRLGLVLLVALVLVLPVAGTTAAGQRLAGTFSGDASTTDHLESLEAGVDGLVASPLGRGLGTAPGVGDRFDVTGRLTAENAYLQVGTELGVVAMLLFAALLGVAVVRLRRAALGGGPGAGTASGLAAAGLGLAVGGMFLHVWLDFTTAVTFWALAGAALGARPPAEPGDRQDAGDRAHPAPGPGGAA